MGGGPNQTPRFPRPSPPLEASLMLVIDAGMPERFTLAGRASPEAAREGFPDMKAVRTQPLSMNRPRELEAPPGVVSY